MTEWNAADYSKQSALQKWIADKSLAGLAIDGSERVLDVGCGDGKITADIAARLPRGSIVGIDPSSDMVDFARQHFASSHRNLEFRVGDAARLSFRDEFDLVVSFNALHWVRDREAALRGMRESLRPNGRALLQFVSLGARRSLEDVIEETRRSPRWASSFADYEAPYVHSVPQEYAGLAEAAGFRVEALTTRLEAWNFDSREAFRHFAQATFVEWTRRIPAEQHEQFISEVLDRYRLVGDGSAADADVFHFYQTRFELRRAGPGRKIADGRRTGARDVPRRPLSRRSDG